MAGHDGNGKTEENSTKKKLLDCCNSARCGGNAEKSGKRNFVFKQKDVREDVSNPEQSNRNKSQKEPEDEVPFPEVVFVKTQIGKSSDSNPAKRGPQKNDRRNLNASAEITVEGKPAHNGKNILLGQPSAHPIQGRREETSEQDHTAKIGEQALQGFKTDRIRIHAVISMR